jgi:mevalonate kinase
MLFFLYKFVCYFFTQPFQNSYIEYFFRFPGNHTSVPVNQSLKILLVNTNKPRNTKTLVAHVRQKYEAYPKVVLPIMEAIGGIGQVFLDTLAEMDKDSSQAEHHYRY